MILSHYRYRPVTVLDPTLPNIVQRDISSNQSYRTLLTVTVNHNFYCIYVNDEKL